MVGSGAPQGWEYKHVLGVLEAQKLRHSHLGPLLRVPHLSSSCSSREHLLPPKPWTPLRADSWHVCTAPPVMSCGLFSCQHSDVRKVAWIG